VLAERWRENGVNVGFPLCADPRHEGPMRDVLVRCVEFLLERMPPGALAGLILTGSFARGEGSVITTARGPRVLGDIEFLVILPGTVELHEFRGRMPDWSRELGGQLSDRVRVEIEFGPAGIGYLRNRARPSIFVHDLIAHGKVVWGRPDLLGFVHPFTAADIPRQDALALLFNRTVEQLEAYDRVAWLEGEDLWETAYHRLKVVLDVAGSVLAFRGRHTPRYAERPAAFARLVAETPELAAVLPRAFPEELERAARLKIAPGDGSAVLPPDLSLAAQRAWIRERIVAGIPAVTSVMRWELESLLGVRDELPGLLKRYLGTQPFARRAWDWAKVALHPFPSPLPLGPLRSARLFLRSTPRALLYVAGTLAYLNLARPTASPPAIWRLIFARRAVRRRDPEAQRQTITTLWRWCVRNT
jgi:hypothetical protein